MSVVMTERDRAKRRLCVCRVHKQGQACLDNRNGLTCRSWVRRLVSNDSIVSSALLWREALDAVHGGPVGCCRNEPGLDVLCGSVRNMQTGRSAHTHRDIAAQLCSDQPSTFSQRSLIIVIYSNRLYRLVIEYALATLNQFVDVSGYS
jgi:hypothetical protein